MRWSSRGKRNRSHQLHQRKGTKVTPACPHSQEVDPDSGTWRSSVPSSWPASWRKSPASPQRAWASSPSVVWTWWTPTPPARARACAAQAVSGAGTRTGVPAASGATAGPTTAPSAEAVAAGQGTQPPVNRNTGAPGQPSLAPALQPGEAAAMIPPPQSSVRKPRYVRRERPSDRGAGPAAVSLVEARVSNV
ncbi:uncharacterized protein C1orf159 homolog isoform X13 [Phyllostomus hastatus]|uniref:uncharacterized protein C1orf159 homolog isoform X13 n=1 Tax=Phyllostomus hastatus TaxID=9423 RepID=UPI001E683F79|nr:uncharacterized protein C1orf159 homolog isoform X13 [Phyllostomus hastatus]